MELLKLKHPIEINGKKVEELTYDPQQITVEMFAQAEARKMAAAKRNISMTMACEMDYSFHIYLGFMAVIAVNPEIDVTDLERASGSDLIAFSRIGRLFTFGTAAEASEDETSDEQSETTPEHSTPQSETSNKKD